MVGCIRYIAYRLVKLRKANLKTILDEILRKRVIKRGKLKVLVQASLNEAMRALLAGVLGNGPK